MGTCTTSCGSRPKSPLPREPLQLRRDEEVRMIPNDRPPEREPELDPFIRGGAREQHLVLLHRLKAAEGDTRG